MRSERKVDNVSQEDIDFSEINDLTPLMHSNGSDDKLQHELPNLMELSQIERSETSIKWYLLINLCTIWMTAYHCIFNISALQTSLMTDLSLDNTQFALLTSIVFLAAMLSALISPWIINRTDIYWSLIWASLTVIIGQALFILGLFLMIHTNQSYLYSIGYFLLYFGRALIGIALGIDDVAVNTIYSLWFGKSRWVSVAFITLAQTLEIGSITARYCIVPIKNIRNSLLDPFILGLAFGALSLFSSFWMLYLDQVYTKQSNLIYQICPGNHKNNDRINQGQNEVQQQTFKMITFERDFTSLTQFSVKLWLIIIFISLGWANIETFLSQMTDVFVNEYKMTEWNANLLLSTTSVVGVVLNPFWGWIFGIYPISVPYFEIASQIAGIISLLLFAFINDYIGLWIGIVLFILNIEWYFASAFVELYAECPVQLLSVANSINAVLYLLAAIVETYLFGLIADVANYKWCLIMMSFVGFIAMIIAIIKTMI